VKTSPWLIAVTVAVVPVFEIHNEVEKTKPGVKSMLSADLFRHR
jgi:hypothetical protein